MNRQHVSTSFRALSLTATLLIGARQLAHAQFSSTGGSTTTTDNVGIGLAIPTAKLQIQSGFSVICGGFDINGNPTPCTANGIPALAINWQRPGNNQTAGYGPCSNAITPPDILRIYTQYQAYGTAPATVTVPYLWMNSDGKTGIGMYPKTGDQFSVGGYTYLNGNTQVTTALRISSNTALTSNDWAPANFPYTFSVDNGDANFAGNTTTGGSAKVLGSVQIGSTSPQTGTYTPWRLAVDGNIACRKVFVETTDWADFVFSPTYRISSLPQLERYILANRHLPDMPSEAAVKEKGIEVGEMNKLLLQKVEELTLQLIELNKKVEAIKMRH